MLHPAITTAVCPPSPEFGDPPPPGPLDSQGPGTEPFGGLQDGVSQFYGGGSDWQRRFNDVFCKPDHRLYDTQGPQGNLGTQVQALAGRPALRRRPRFGRFRRPRAMRARRSLKPPPSLLSSSTVGKRPRR